MKVPDYIAESSSLMLTHRWGQTSSCFKLSSSGWYSLL